LVVVRSFLVLLAACGGAAPSTTTSPPVDPKPAKQGVVEEHPAPIDPIGVLAPVEDQPVSWLSPGPVQLELGGATVESPGGNRPIQVALVDRANNYVRAVVRLPHARFSLWSDRARLFGVIKHEHRVTPIDARPTEMYAVLHAGARVKRLARKNKRTQIRYVGAIEVETWVPDEVLGDQADADRRTGKIPTGKRSAMLFPGSVIRTEPVWGNNQLAVATNGYQIDSLRELEDGWMEVGYSDGDVAVRGYASKRQPPGTIHRPKDPDAPPPVTAPNTKVASGTCLYAKRDGEAVGYIVGDQDVQLDDAGNGWWTLAVDTPWGPMPFAARGPSGSALTPCAPSGSVPAPAGTTVP
jgi:hypothetical protein